jgi:hypothetical protein
MLNPFALAISREFCATMGMKILNLQMCFLQPTLHNDSNDVELKIRSRAS